MTTMTLYDCSTAPSPRRARILLAESVVDRVLLLCPSLTIESALRTKFKQLSADRRLLDLKVENFLLQSTLRAVIAQRLVRILCERCKIERRLTPADLAADPRYAVLGLEAGELVHEGGGCERCGGTGYRGRTGVFEILETTEDVRKLIGTRTDSGTIARAACATGMTSMFDHAVSKCRAGITSAAEVLRVTTVR